MKRSGTLKGTRSPPHAVDERGALNSMREERLTSIFIIEVKNVSFLIITLFLFLTRLPVPYSSDCDSLLVALNIKPSAYNLDDYGSDAYSLPI